MFKTIFKCILDVNSLKTKRKLIVIMSDDWGALRIKSLEDQYDLISKGLSINNRFDRFDTLETNSDIEFLFEILTKYKDFNGNHPCITAVTNVGNPDFKKINDSHFQNYYFETIKDTYKRYTNSDRVLSLIHEGIQQKIFIPQSHGREHLQINWWMQELQNENSYARKFFENEFYFIPSQLLTKSYRNRDLSAAFDVWKTDDLIKQNDIITSSLTIFENLFGFKSKIFTPPAMFYNTAIEKHLYNQNIEWIDVGRFLKTPLINGGEAWQLNYLGRKKKYGLRVLVRNAMFETNLSESDNGVDRCLRDIGLAFQSKQPAIISNHRASFSGRIDVKNRDRGIRALDELLKRIMEKWPDVEFIEATDLK